MTTIAPITSRDVEKLASQFPPDDADKDVAQIFHECYLEHLQDNWLVLVAHTGENNERVQGYVVMLWTSPRSYFWRRSLPEITTIEATTPQVETALLTACEEYAHAERDGIGYYTEDDATAERLQRHGYEEATSQHWVTWL